MEKSTDNDLVTERPADVRRGSGSLDALLDRSLAPLLWQPDRLGAISAWWTHVPFAYWLVTETKPRVLVELGTHNGVSYSAFCCAVQRGGLATRCHAVDTWLGDPQSGEYGREVYEEFRRFHDERFGTFSTLVRSTFDRALVTFGDGSIDLLHIDGLHTFEAVRHDFFSWSPKLSDRAVVLLHDTNERRDDFGVWRLWDELRQRYPAFEFLHGHGLGVLAFGNRAPQAVMDLCALSDPTDVASVRGHFARAGHFWLLDAEIKRIDLNDKEVAAARAEQARSEMEQVRLEAQAAIGQVQAEARAQVEQARAESKRFLDAVTLESEERVAQAIRERDRFAYAVRAAERRAEEAETAAVSAAARATAIETSAIWRATRPARLFVERLRKTARLARRPIQLGWRIIMLQLPQRLRERGKKIRTLLSSHLFDRARQTGYSYSRWVREYDTLDDSDRQAIRVHIDELSWRPFISVVVPVYNTEADHLREMFESVRRQIYPHWELCLADDASTSPHIGRMLQEFAAIDHRVKVVTRQENGHVSAATNSALDLATGEFVALLDHDDVLAEQALYEIAVELNAHSDADVVYSDSDSIDDRGRRSVPYFKTDWDPDLMLGHNMVSHLGVYRRSVVDRIGRLRRGFEGSQDYDLMLRAAEATVPSRIRHVPDVLYHWRRGSTSPSFSEADLDRCVAAARRAIGEHLERTGRRFRVEAAPRTRSFTRIVDLLPKEHPLVSIVVLTRDRADLLARCADGILTRTCYEPLELVIVDNDSNEPETQRLLSKLGEDRRVRIIQHSGTFNFAAMNNRAVQEARGDIVVLLNNDVDVISSQWLEEMVSQALRPEIGAVGAKLLHQDGRVQHAGVILGVGHGAGHFFHGAGREDVGPFGLLALTRRVSAVTAACVALRRSVYLQVGGMDELEFPVAFNDVDLCLRIGQHGYAVLWTPYAELYHLESATRGADTDSERLRRLQRDAGALRRRWGSLLDNDPHYNPNCSLTTAYFEPGFPPRRRKSWLPFKKPATGSAAGVSRADILLAPLDKSVSIIEIGPSYSPLAPKSAGWKTRTLDHTTRAALIEKYRGHPGVDIAQIEEVDFVWTDGPMVDAVPSDLHGTFDAFIASHVIEHTPDLVGFLDAAQTLLASNGVVILAVPDRRYCFDYFRPITTTGDVLDVHIDHRSRHTRRSLFNHTAYVVKNGGTGAWGQAPMRDIEFFHSLEQAGQVFAAASDQSGSPYVDAHAWQFTPASFELLILELARLGETDWMVDRITPATGCEFYVWLRRGGRAAAAAMSASQVEKRRLALLKRTLLQVGDQIAFLVAGHTEVK